MSIRMPSRLVILSIRRQQELSDVLTMVKQKCSLCNIRANKNVVLLTKIEITRTQQLMNPTKKTKTGTYILCPKKFQKEVVTCKGESHSVRSRTP